MSTTARDAGFVAAECPSWCAEHQELDGEFVSHSRSIETTAEGVWIELAREEANPEPYVQLDASTARLTAAEARALAATLVEAAGLLDGR